MINSLVEYTIYWINVFPSRSGASKTMSPSNIILGRARPNFNYSQIEYGAYAMVFSGTANNMSAQGIPCIALKPSNEIGGYYFMSLLSEKRVNTYHWKELPHIQGDNQTSIYSSY